MLPHLAVPPPPAHLLAQALVSPSPFFLFGVDAPGPILAGGVRAGGGGDGAVGGTRELWRKRKRIKF